MRLALTRLLHALALASLAGCEFDEKTVAPGRPQPVVHAVLNPSVFPSYDFFLEWTLTGRVETHEDAFDPDDPIVTGGGEPISGALVDLEGNVGFQGIIIGARAVEVSTLRADGKGRGVYRFLNMPPPPFGDVPNALPVIRSRRYTLRITLPDGRVAFAEATVPQPLPRVDTLPTRTFDRTQDVYDFRWPRADWTHRYALQVQTPFGDFELFTPDTSMLVTGDLRNLFADRLPYVFVPGFLQTLGVFAVDTNYFDYYRSRNDPFTGSGIIDHVDGGTGLLGAIAPVRVSRLEVVAPIDEPIEGRWQLEDASFPNTFLTLYVEGTFASGRLDDGTPTGRRGVLGSRAGDGRLALAVLQRQSARDTLYTMSARLSGGTLLTLVTGDPGEERRWRRASTP